MRTLSALACWCAVLSPLVSAHAQIIRVKPLPVAETEQFSFLPTAGMAGVSIALPDTLQDPFLNPAKGSRAGKQYFGAPSFFSVSGNSGAGTTFPLGAFLRRGASFAAFAAAIQQIHLPQRAPSFFAIPARDVAPLPGADASTPTPSSQSNNYSFALFGHTVEAWKLSIAGSVLWSGLAAVDGVDQFYVRRDWLRQRGTALDMRLGVVKQTEKRETFEALLLRNSFGHDHDIGFTDRYWDPTLRRPVAVARTEHNGEETDTWGIHLEYERPVFDTAWRAGTLFTANRINHSRIPGYNLLNGFGRGGRSTAYNIGVGVARSVKDFAFGVDAIYEPITTRTSTPDSVENRLRFSNAKLRAGVSKSFTMMDPGSVLRFHLGAELYSVHYVMNQRDLVGDLDRVRRETWLERTKTAGMSFRVPGIEVHYQVRSRTGLGRPGVISNDGIVIESLSPPSSSSFAPFPQPVPSETLGSVRVTWHQFAISIPRR
jgi:hypothetical protein